MICDLSRSGALVQSPRPLAPGSEHTIELASDACTVVARGRVVRIGPSDGPGCLVALEFLDLHAALMQEIDRIPLATDDRVAPYGPERRGFPRRAAIATARLRLSADIAVMDISLTGALLRCECPLRVGDRARIEIVLSPDPFTASVSVVRLAAERSDHEGKAHIGVMFAGDAEERAGILQRFLRVAELRAESVIRASEV
jgi:hypothetical protein